MVKIDDIDSEVPIDRTSRRHKIKYVARFAWMFGFIPKDFY